ncbi:MAG: OmpH family outer membrane protein [Marinifilaceae bacterium]
MKNILKIVAIVAFSIATLTVSAQTKTQKLGHIETEKLLKIMPEMIAAEKTLQTKRDDVIKESNSLREQYQKMITEYQEKQPTYTDVVRKAKEQEIMEYQQRIQRFEELAGNELQKSQQDLIQPIMDKALKAIKDVAKENGYTYVFDMSAGSILYSADNADDLLPLVKTKLGIK